MLAILICIATEVTPEISGLLNLFRLLQIRIRSTKTVARRTLVNLSAARTLEAEYRCHFLTLTPRMSREQKCFTFASRARTACGLDSLVSLWPMLAVCR